MIDLIGGPDRDRTDDLFHAMEARSQLRHRPTLHETLLLYCHHSGWIRQTLLLAPDPAFTAEPILSAELCGDYGCAIRLLELCIQGAALLNLYRLSGVAAVFSMLGALSTPESLFSATARPCLAHSIGYLRCCDIQCHSERAESVKMSGELRSLFPKGNLP